MTTSSKATRAGHACQRVAIASLGPDDGHARCRTAGGAFCPLAPEMPPRHVNLGASDSVGHSESFNLFCAATPIRQDGLAVFSVARGTSFHRSGGTAEARRGSGLSYSININKDFAGVVLRMPWRLVPVEDGRKTRVRSFQQLAP